MKRTWTVDGEKVIKFSVLVHAETMEEAEKLAEEYWEHNTTGEYFVIDGVWSGDLNG